jgi:predicted GH43/DUF377 family glycosyl hydrolase
MALTVNRTGIRLNPDISRVIPRFFNTGETRSLALIAKVVAIPEEEASQLLLRIKEEFCARYRDIDAVFDKHFQLIQHLLPELTLNTLSREKKMLLGSYFTMEYSLEAAALFNPSIVEDPDQSGTAPGEKNVIISFRAVGEGHISSLVFKRAKLDKDLMIHIEPSTGFTGEGMITQVMRNKKDVFEELLLQTTLPENVRLLILAQLKDSFTYKEIESVLKSYLRLIDSATERNKLKYDILSMVNTSYEVNFPAGSRLTEQVIFPVTFTEKNGIEDARFVKFTNDDGSFQYIATYTAYDGTFILPHLIKTKDFLHFKMSALHGKMAINKNLALFPRKINGQYAMISRIDGINNYISFSDDLYLWETATLLQQPQYPWEFIQIGNGGSPIETAKGWLIITHGVGPMRKYCLGASLFDLNDPTKQIGRLKEPLLVPNEDERKGYVPNVVYSCGAIIHQDQLFIPYAVSDHATSFASIPLDMLLNELLQSPE